MAVFSCRPRYGFSLGGKHSVSVRNLHTREAGARQSHPRCAFYAGWDIFKCKQKD